MPNNKAFQRRKINSRAKLVWLSGSQPQAMLVEDRDIQIMPPHTSAVRGLLSLLSELFLCKVALQRPGNGREDPKLDLSLWTLVDLSPFLTFPLLPFKDPLFSTFSDFFVVSPDGRLLYDATDIIEKRDQRQRFEKCEGNHIWSIHVSFLPYLLLFHLPGQYYKPSSTWSCSFPACETWAERKREGMPLKGPGLWTNNELPWTERGHLAR